MKWLKKFESHSVGFKELESYEEVEMLQKKLKAVPFQQYEIDELKKIAEQYNIKGMNYWEKTGESTYMPVNQSSSFINCISLIQKNHSMDIQKLDDDYFIFESITLSIFYLCEELNGLLECAHHNMQLMNTDN